MAQVRLFSDIEVESMKMDIYLPDERNPPPPGGRSVVYFIHGGAWLTGSKESCREQCRTLAENGYVAVAPNFALSSVDFWTVGLVINMMAALLVVFTLASHNSHEIALLLLLALVAVCFAYVLGSLPRTTDTSQVQHPAHIQDLARGLEWMSKNIQQYEGDANRIHLLGHSAGGHLAALLATNTTYLVAAGVDPSIVKSCTSISGVYSDQRMKETKMGQELLKTVFGDRKQYFDAFPIYNVSSRSPPFLLLNAEYDISLKRHSYDFHYTLREAGAYVRTEYFPDLTHFSIVQDWHSANRSVIKTITEFIQEIDDIVLKTDATTSLPWLRVI